jgi:hypothetical protein
VAEKVLEIKEQSEEGPKNGPPLDEDKQEEDATT